MYYFHYDFSCKKSPTFTTILRVKKCYFHYDMQKIIIVGLEGTYVGEEAAEIRRGTRHAY
jgi:hypothetical protein